MMRGVISGFGEVLEENSRNQESAGVGNPQKSDENSRRRSSTSSQRGEVSSKINTGIPRKKVPPIPLPKRKPKQTETKKRNSIQALARRLSEQSKDPTPRRGTVPDISIEDGCSPAESSRIPSKLISANAKLKSENMIFHEEKEVLEDSNREAELRAQELTRTIKKLEGEKVRLEKTSDELRDAEVEAIQKLTNAELLVQTEREKAKRAEEESTALKNSISLFLNYENGDSIKPQRLVEELQDRAQKLQNLTETSESMSSRLNVLMREKSDLKKDLADKVMEVDQLEKQYLKATNNSTKSQSENAKIKTMESNMQKIMKENSSFKEEIEILKSQLYEEQDNLKNARLRIEAQNEALQDLTSDRSTISFNNSGVPDSALEYMDPATVSLRKTIDTLTEEKSKLEFSITQMVPGEQFASAEKKIFKLQDETEQKRKEILYLQKELSQSNDEVLTLRSQFQSIMETSQQADSSYKSQLNSMSKEKSVLEDQLQNKSEAFETMQKRHESTIEELKSLYEKLSEAESVSSNRLQDIDLLKEELENVKAWLEDEQEKHKFSLSKLDNAEEKLEEEQKKLVELSREIKESSANFQSLVLQESLKTAEDLKLDLERTKKRMKENESDLEATTQQLNQLTEENAELCKQNEILTRQCKKRQEQLDKANSILESSKFELSKHRTEKVELETSNREMKEKVHGEEARSQRLEREMAKLMSELDRITSIHEKETQKNRTSQLSEALKSAMDELKDNRRIIESNGLANLPWSASDEMELRRIKKNLTETMRAKDWAIQEGELAYQQLMEDHKRISLEHARFLCDQHSFETKKVHERTVLFKLVVEIVGELFFAPEAHEADKFTDINDFVSVKGSPRESPKEELEFYEQENDSDLENKPDMEVDEEVVKEGCRQS
eukprot:GHVP01009655.1.p1 GENE.GHVP01009655.1~~GHVP01009655.1.p1  ORF type:complete len:901 (+),score=252.91 GHVP01009655.1:412-3114(+)